MMSGIYYLAEVAFLVVIGLQCCTQPVFGKALLGDHVCSSYDIAAQRYTVECCPGWAENNRRCSVPICDEPCGYGGICVQPNTCQCRQGFQGDGCTEIIKSCDELMDTCTEVCLSNNHQPLANGCYRFPDDGHVHNTSLCIQPTALTSSIPWYTRNDDPTNIFTRGVVYLDDGISNIPLSLHGVEVNVNDDAFAILTSMSNHIIGNVTVPNMEDSEDCVSTTSNHGDQQEVAFLRTHIHAVKGRLPMWFKIHILNHNEITTETIILRGQDIGESHPLFGVPLDQDKYYTVMSFYSPVTYSVYNDFACGPDYSVDTRMYLATELCGDAIFLLMPGTASTLSELEIVNTLSQIGINLNFVAFGFSGSNSIQNGNTNLELWNGEMFEYEQSSGYTIWTELEISNENRETPPPIGLEVQSSIKTLLAVNDMEKILSHSFFDRVDALLDIQGKIELHFKVFGNQVYIPFVQMQLSAYLSIGGVDRDWCEDPSGLFAKVWLTASPFGDTILSDLFANFESSAHVFVNYGSERVFLPHDDVVEDLELMMNVVDDITAILELNPDHTIHPDIYPTAVSLRSQLSSVIEVESSGQYNAISLQDQLYDLRSTVDQLTRSWDEVQARQELLLPDTIVATVSDSIFFINHKLDQIGSRHIHDILSLPNIMDATGFGLKFNAELTLYGLDFGTVGVEFVKSPTIGRCNPFSLVYEDIVGNDAIMGRITIGGSFSLKKIPFIELAVGLGHQFAFSTDRPVFLFGFTSTASLLGMTLETNLYVNNKLVFFHGDGKLWDVFYATVTALTTLNVPQEEQKWKVTGEFGFGEKGFSMTMAEALNAAISQQAEKAVERLDQAQKTVAYFQDSLRSAESWLAMKQQEVQQANVVFDEAVRVLQEKTNEMEQAKEILEQANERLREQQKNINSLCVIKTCRSVCIPGWKCRWCYKKVGIIKRFPLPCCQKDSCMISFKDPACVLSNLACQATRKLAFAGLKIAEWGVTLAIDSLDVATMILEVAEMAADRSRVLLHVAEIALELAEGAVATFRHLQEITINVLEVLKNALKEGLRISKLIVGGIAVIIDVQGGRFEVEVSSGDEFILYTEMEVNIFQTGWRRYGFYFNIKDSHTSIRIIAKSIAKTIADAPEETDVIPTGPETPTNEPSSEAINRTSLYNETLFVASRESEYLKNLRYEQKENDYRIATFAEKCQDLMNASDFIQMAFNVLRDVSSDSKASKQNMTDVLQLIDEQADNLSTGMQFDPTGINLTEAENFNITQQDIEDEISLLSNLTDLLANETHESIQLGRNISILQYDSVANLKIIPLWQDVMENVTFDTFSKEDCSSFDDCLAYSFEKMYDLYEGIDLAEVQEMKMNIMNLQQRVNQILANDSLTITDAEEITDDVLDMLREMRELKILCGTPPNITEHPQSIDIRLGDTLTLTCAASGEPEPRIWWYRNFKVIATEHPGPLVINEIDLSDAGSYWCQAGNIIVNETSEVAIINVYLEPSGIFPKDETVTEGQPSRSDIDHSSSVYDDMVKDGSSSTQDSRIHIYAIVCFWYFIENIVYNMYRMNIL